MKKILLIGELNEIMRSVNECLTHDFQVQMCSSQIENVQGMVKIFKPDLVIVNLVGVEELDAGIFQWQQEHYPKLPVLIICVKEEWSRCREYCEGSQFDKLFRPVAKSELLEKCYAMLQLQKVESYRQGRREKRKIMVVDDSPLLLRNMKSILEERYIVFLATSGKQAIQQIPEKQPDLILLDYEMPGMDGIKTFELLKESDFTCDIPVVFLTSISKRKPIYKALQARPAGYLLKPPDREKLLDTIEEVLRKESY